MIWALLRLLLTAALLFGAVYAGIAYLARSKRRIELEREWRAAGEPGSLEDYTSDGLARLDAALRRRALGALVFLSPVALGIVFYVIEN